MAGSLSKRLTFLFCCLLSSIGILFYGHESLTVRYADNIFSFFDISSKRSSELNGFNDSWPNYQHIWREYYGTIPSFYSCPDFAKGNAKNISHYAFQGRIPLTKEPVLSMECDHIRRRVMGNTVYKRVKHPYAIARNVYENYHIQELLLSFSYSPSNMYCYAIDKKSQKTFKKNLKQLGNCLPNVFVMEKEYLFDSAGHKQDQAHYDCSAEMLQYSGWEYLMFSQNADIFLKTPEEISDVISVLNGSAFTSMSNPNKSRVPKSSWTPKELKLFRNESQFTKEQLNKAIVPRKSPNHMFLPREFIQVIHEKLNLSKIIDLFGSKKYGVDEMLYATLLHADFLNLPGQIENKCIVRDTFRYLFFDFLIGENRYVHWNFGKAEKCQSFKKRHGVCLIGMEYIPIIIKEPHIIANKIWPEWDFGVIMCMGEILYNRTNVDKKYKINLKPYQNIPQVREHSLKLQGKFNSSSFKC